MEIIGDGKDKDKLEKKYTSEKIKFLGKMPRGKTLEKLKDGDIFISLNPHEPFGLVYLEALLNKCKIICPNTGGQMEFLNELEEVLFIDINNIEKYRSDYEQLIRLTGFKNFSLREYFDYFNYKRVAKEIIDL